MNFVISRESIKKQNVGIFYEEAAFTGVKYVADLVKTDLERVFGSAPLVKEVSKDVAAEELSGQIFVATVGNSDLLDKLGDDVKQSVAKVSGKREVYFFGLLQIAGKEPTLCIIGSEKRGTIYGLFHLSELLGVSPLTNWNHVMPTEKDKIELDDDHTIISKEPSVRYRGFFINDEWPAFGNWSEHHFGGFTKECYAQVFELLLRLKGNYMWPAMWSSIFSEDGPGLANAELADMLGVVMGMSHHEPCLRNGEEYRYVRGKDSVYGDAWNFRTNEAGITRFWEDGLKRSGKFENVITVGMRGEADSTIMGEDATLKDNIDLLRDVLKCQNKLIRENVNEDLDQVPRMLALYKEVEPFFYGDETTEGLIGDPELEGVTLMLCDDNFGNLRTVPTEEMRSHKGGYGMYYHFDYHGWPISFEWINSSYLPKIWEQMTNAYEFGIRDLWIVNVGDIFTTEYPLSFFLDLAYDFDKWGSLNANSAYQYTMKWMLTQFGEKITGEQQDEILILLREYTKIASIRRPEAMNDQVYTMAYGEAEALSLRCENLMERCEALLSAVSQDVSFPFFEFVYYPLMGNLIVQRLWCETVINHYLAKIGATEASVHAQIVEELLQKDKELTEKIHTLDNERWYGMGMSEHIGFRHWNEEECQYPTIWTKKPANKKRLIVTIAGTDQFSEGGVWTAQTLKGTLDPVHQKLVVRIYTASEKDTDFKVEVSDDCLECIALSSTGGSVPGYGHTDVVVSVSDDTLECMQEGDFEGKVRLVVLTENEGRIPVEITLESYPAICVLEAADFVKDTVVEDAAFRLIHDYGKYQDGIRVTPVTKSFALGEGPSVTYRFMAAKSGEYRICLYVSPSNPPYQDQKLLYGLKIGNGDLTVKNAVSDGFRIGDHQAGWTQGVLDNIRVLEHTAVLEAGEQDITIYAMTPGFVLQHIVCVPTSVKILPSYMGPK